jgi:hypothetical protein
VTPPKTLSYVNKPTSHSPRILVRRWLMGKLWMWTQPMSKPITDYDARSRGPKSWVTPTSSWVLSRRRTRGGMSHKFESILEGGRNALVPWCVVRTQLRATVLGMRPFLLQGGDRRRDIMAEMGHGAAQRRRQGAVLLRSSRLREGRLPTDQGFSTVFAQHAPQRD